MLDILKNVITASTSTAVTGKVSTHFVYIVSLITSVILFNVKGKSASTAVTGTVYRVTPKKNDPTQSVIEK